jgi:hypothetical protein
MSTSALEVGVSCSHAGLPTFPSLLPSFTMAFLETIANAHSSDFMHSSWPWCTGHRHTSLGNSLWSIG